MPQTHTGFLSRARSRGRRPSITTGAAKRDRAVVVDELDHQAGLHHARRSRQALDQHDEGHAVEDPTDERGAEVVGCEGQDVCSASERRQPDRTVGFEAKWAYLRFHCGNVDSDTLVRISSNLTNRSSNLRHGLLGSPIPACYSKSASTSDRQIVVSAAAKAPWTGQIFVSSTGDRRRKV